MPSRRSFLFSAALAGAAVIGAESLFAQYANAPAMPDRALLNSNEDAFWAALRKQFPIPPGEVFLNNGTCGSTPFPVLKEIFDAYNRFEQLDDPDPEQYPLFGYYAFRQYRDPLARFVGVSTDEIAIVRNATEANAIMANGLDLKSSDEVLISDQEHPSGNSPWEMRAKRYGIVIKRFEIPKPPKSAADILNRVNDAITPRTRVIFVSHITTVTGVVLPVKEICTLARSKGIISMIDGAQVIGMMPLNIRDIGCDMYGSSPHKWLMGPKGTGFLYVRDELIDRVWSNTTTEGWDDKKMRAQRFQQYGSANLPVIVGLVAAIKFHEEIGLDRIERRNRSLADYLLEQMIARHAESWTSPDPTLRAAIVTVNVPPVPRLPLEKWLWNTHKIRIRGGDPNKLRLSTPYYLQKADIDNFLQKFDEFSANMGQAATP